MPGRVTRLSANLITRRSGPTVPWIARRLFQINEAFKVSTQFWSYLIEQGRLSSPAEFIQRIPHLSFIHGAKNVEFLRKRFAALHANHLFAGMEYTEDRAQLAEWMPLVMDGRDDKEPVAATRMRFGTDVNFGALSRSLISHLQTLEV